MSYIGNCEWLIEKINCSDQTLIFQYQVLKLLWDCSKKIGGEHLMLVITTKKEFSMKVNIINTENSVGSVFYTIAS